VSIAGTTVSEPTTGTRPANFGVSLSSAAETPVSVEYATHDGAGATGATAPSDYEATQGTLTFNPGETTKTIPVNVKNGGFAGTRTFTVALSNAQNAGIATGEATGTINGLLTVSGTVYGLACESTCTRSGLPHQTILLQGTASDGSAVATSAVTDASGVWTVVAPSGKYVAGTTLDGTTIEGQGFEPETLPVAVGAEDVAEQDFTTCAATPAAVAKASRVTGRGGSLVAHGAQVSPAYGDLCQATYKLQASANIPQASFVDPSPLAPYARKDDGEGYAANNTNFFNTWWRQLPLCKEFAYVTPRRTPLDWLSYYRGKTQLGTATVDLLYHRYTKEVTATTPALSAGRLTRVFDYRKGDGTTGSCEDTRDVVPQVSSKINGTSFTVVVSWAVPFTPEGFPTTEKDITLVPGVKASVHKLVDKALEEVPGFKSLDPAYKVITTFLVAEAVEHTVPHFFSKLPSVHSVIELAEATIPYEKDINLPLLVTQFGYNWLASQVGKLDGYQPMVMVIRGKLEEIECPPIGQPYRECGYTQLAVGATTGAFPNYHLTIYRNAGALPTAPSGTGKIRVSLGPEAAPLPDINQSEEKFPGSKGGGRDVKDLVKAMKAVGPNALQVEAGTALYGLPEDGFPFCDPEKYTAGTAHTRCYTFADGLA